MAEPEGESGWERPGRGETCPSCRRELAAALRRDPDATWPELIAVAKRRSDQAIRSTRPDMPEW